MNKAKKQWNETKDIPVLKSAPPDSCQFCGYTPEKMKEDYGVPWMVLGVPNSTFIVYQCPHCNMLSGNIHAVANTKILMEERKHQGKRILTPDKRIILPGNNGG